MSPLCKETTNFTRTMAMFVSLPQLIKTRLIDDVLTLANAKRTLSLEING